MATNKTVLSLTTLLRSLQKREWVALERFVRSPYHNPQAELVELLPYYQHGRKEDVAAVYARLFPQRPYTHRRWLAAQRALLSLVKAFIFQQELRRQPVRTATQRTRAYSSRRLPHYALRQAESALDTLPDAALPRWESAALQIQLSQAIYQSPAGQSRREELSLLLHELQIHYVLLRLRYGTDLLARGITYDEPGETLRDLLPLVQRLRPSEPLADFYYCVYAAYLHAKQPDSEELLGLEARYHEYYPNLHPSDRTFWLVKLCNLFNRATQAGLPGFRSHLFRLYRFGVEQQLTLVDGRITEVSFLNLVGLGTAVGELAWVERFRMTFLPLLAIPDRHNARQISAAYLHFHRGEHAAVHDCLKTLRKPALLHQLYARPLELQSLLSRFLADDSLLGLLRSRLDTCYRWVYRDRRIAPSRKAEYQQFIKIIRLIVRTQEQRLPAAAAREQLHAAIANGPGMIAREWVLQVVDSL